jgi:superfamily I DNA/RNA helicase
LAASEQEIEQARAEALKAILDSDAEKKLIVAGPGTGKTHTFHKALEQCGERGLALTFIRNLVADLSSALDDVADVFTFHGFCKHLVHRNPVAGLTKNWDYYPSLKDLLLIDLEWLGQGKLSGIELDGYFHRLDDGEPVLDEALRLGAYYDAVGHTDLVYRALRHFEGNDGDVPSYPLIVVDEYQDFSLLETSFLDLLAAKSPVLIAGDDDQALYGFKQAKPDFIRELSNGDEYTDFKLPYCSRCTQVVVSAVNDAIRAAVSEGHLVGRLDKPFECYVPSKAEDSAAHPKIIHARCTVERKKSPFAGRYVAQQIAAIPEADVLESKEGDGYPTVLVIGPNPFLESAYKVIKADFPQAELKKGSDVKIEALDGYRRLLRDERSRLGWRIIVHSFPTAEAQAATAEALRTESELADDLPENYRQRHLEVVGWLRQLKADADVDAELIDRVEGAVGQSIDEILVELGVELEVEDDGDEATDDEELPEDEPTIICTTLVGAKGLSAAYVFIVGFANGHFPRDPHEISDNEICQFLVGLSRTRKACHLLSCGSLGQTRLSASAFAGWIEPHLEERKIDAAYFKG